MSDALSTTASVGSPGLKNKTQLKTEQKCSQQFYSYRICRIVQYGLV